MMTLEEAIESIKSADKSPEEVLCMVQKYKPLMKEIKGSELAHTLAKSLTKIHILSYMIDPEDFVLTMIGMGVIIGVQMEKQDL